jgi:hypothetical protein
MPARTVSAAVLSNRQQCNNSAAVVITVTGHTTCYCIHIGLTSVIHHHQQLPKMIHCKLQQRWYLVGKTSFLQPSTPLSAVVLAAESANTITVCSFKYVLTWAAVSTSPGVEQLISCACHLFSLVAQHVCV